MVRKGSNWIISIKPNIIINSTHYTTHHLLHLWFFMSMATSITLLNLAPPTQQSCTAWRALPQRIRGLPLFSLLFTLPVTMSFYRFMFSVWLITTCKGLADCAVIRVQLWYYVKAGTSFRYYEFTCVQSIMFIVSYIDLLYCSSSRAVLRLPQGRTTPHAACSTFALTRSSLCTRTTTSSVASHRWRSRGAAVCCSPDTTTSIATSGTRWRRRGPVSNWQKCYIFNGVIEFIQLIMY